MLKINLQLLIVSLSLLIAMPAMATQPMKVVGNVNLETSALTVVAREKLKSGHTLEVVKMQDGSLAKRVVMQNSNVLSVPNHVPFYEAPAYQAPFVETFESFDGETIDWIPEGWQDICKSDPPHVAPTVKALNYTWQVEAPGFDVALEGFYSARVQNAFYTNPENPQELVFEYQDEWLITPTVGVTEKNVLYFYLGYHPGWTLLNMQDWMFNKVNNIMEVLISEDEGENWVKVWDCLDDAYSYSNQQLLEDLQALTVMWVPFHIDLSAYQGKNIKVAFRYVGSEGESMRIDAVSIKRPTPQAFYVNPLGSFYNGFSPNFQMPLNKALLYGAYGDCEWLNYSNMDSERFEWSYTMDTEEVKTSTDVDLAYYCKPGRYGIPQLTAYAEYGDPSSYKYEAEYIQLGGNNAVDGIEYSACNYDVANSIGAYQMDDYYIFGAGSNELWTSWLAQNARQEVELTGIANYFPAPNHTYYFTKVWVNAIINANADGELTLDILEVENGGISLEPIATAKCKLSEITQTSVDGNKYATIMFDFGRPVTVEDAIMMRISGYDDPVIKKFAVLNQYVPNSNGMNYAYGFLTIKEGESSSLTLVPASQITTSLGALNTAFCFNMDATFTWLECNNLDMNASYEKTSKGFKFFTEYKAEDFVLEGEGLGDWITYKLGEYDDEAKTQTVTLTLSENMEDVRVSAVTVRIPGSLKVINISQEKHPDYDGIESVDSVSKNIVKSGENIIVRGAEGECVSIYNSCGLLVYSQQISENEQMIDMSNYATGVYFVRLSSGVVVKVLN